MEELTGAAIGAIPGFGFRELGVAEDLVYLPSLVALCA